MNEIERRDFLVRGAIASGMIFAPAIIPLRADAASGLNSRPRTTIPPETPPVTVPPGAPPPKRRTATPSKGTSGTLPFTGDDAVPGIIAGSAATAAGAALVARYRAPREEPT